jgi:protein-S-isoprenylcysteine O-methyltransferase Ste14
MFAASNFEFKFRFWIFGFLFWIAFSTYAFDQQNSGAWIADQIANWSGALSGHAAAHLVFAVGALSCVAAASLRTWGTAYLNPEVMVDAQMHTTRLVADGPYRYVRNPLYLGNVFLAIGFGLMASRIGFAVLVLGILFFSYRLILREEAGILASQGESYRAYCAAVPRLFPSLVPKLPASGAKPKWGDGLLGEAFMWLLATSVIAFMITLNLKIFYFVLASAFIAYGLCYAVIRKRQKSKADLQHVQR